MVSTAYLNGYHFGDRLMEGVSYGVKVNSNGDLETFIPKSSQDYMDDFNCKKWLDRAEEYAKNNDIFFETEGLSGEELELVSIGKRKPKSKGVKIKMISFEEILRGLK